MQSDNKVTIDMVSNLAGVSKTTISRYLNGKYEYMSQDTRKRIEEVIDKLDYRPNSLARSLRSKRSGLIGVILSDIVNPFSALLSKGVIDACARAGYQAIVASTDDDPEKERKYIISMLDSQAEGIIVNTTGANDEFLLDIKGKGVQLVLADRSMIGNLIDTVTIDIEKIVPYTIGTLYNEGFEVVAFFSQEFQKNSSRLRQYNAFLRSSEKYNDHPEDLVYIIDEDKITYEEALFNFLNAYPEKRKAIFANGTTMLNLLQVSRKCNLKIPQNFGVVGYDDWGWGELIGDEGITVIKTFAYEVGKKSAEIIIDRIKGNKIENTPVYKELSSELIQRGSTKFYTEGENK